MKSPLEYVRDNGHEMKFSALVCLWHQAIPHVGIEAHEDSLLFRFRSYMQSFNRQVYLQSGYDICSLFIEIEYSQIYELSRAEGNSAM